MTNHSDNFRHETGPMYGVELIKRLPLAGGSMFQAMPSRNDLERVSRQCKLSGDRVASAYEVLLAHYFDAVKEVDRLRRLNE